MSIQVAIIGAYGSAGSAVAGELVDYPDVELLLFDDGDPGGGLCILRGCMPSKEILSAGAHKYQARHDDRLVGEIPDVDLERVVERKDEHTLSWAGHRREGVEKLAEREDVTFVRETARFVDERRIEAGGKQYEPEYVVVATGSSVNIPKTPGIGEVDYMTSADVLDATEFPETGIVMGFGYIGMELVPYLAEAGGMDLTVVEHDLRPIDEAEPPFGDAALELYREEFDVTVPTRVYEKQLEPTDDGGVRLYLEHEDGSEQVVEGDQLFCFTGRKPSIDRVGFGETVPIDSGTESEDAAPETKQFDIVARDKKGNPIVVAHFDQSRDPTHADTIGPFVTDSSDVCEANETLAAAVAVTSSYFEADAMRATEEATSSSLLSRSKHRSYVKLSRSNGYHLCLVEARDNTFNLTVPEL